MEKPLRYIIETGTSQRTHGRRNNTIVSAQTKLDERSRRYLAERAEHAVPSVYRIPKASAEISFAMKQERAEKFSVLVFSSGDSRQQSQQHKVSFDILAAPPPPELMARLERPHIELDFVADFGEREQVLARLQRYSKTASESHQARVRELTKPKKAFYRTIVFRDSEHWLLLKPVLLENNKLSLEVVRVSRTADDVKFELGDPPKEERIPARLRRLVEFLHGLAQRQEVQLKELHRERSEA